MTGFGSTSEAENLRIPESVIDEFRESWSEFDSDVSVNQFRAMVSSQLKTSIICSEDLLRRKLRC